MYRLSNDDYADNQYQNRQLFDQRFNPSNDQQQRAYHTNDEKKNHSKKTFQRNYENYNSYNNNEYLSPNKKPFEKTFHNVNSKSTYYEKHNEVANEFNNEIKLFFTTASKSKFNCRRCDEKFFFNNKFHYHIKRCKIISKSKTFSKNRAETKIIHSSTFNNFNSKLNFKS